MKETSLLTAKILKLLVDWRILRSGTVKNKKATIYSSTNLLTKSRVRAIGALRLQYLERMLGVTDVHSC